MTTPSAPLQIQLRFFLPTSPGEAFRWVSERLPEWRCGDRVGYGWSEYLDQIA